MRPVAKSIVLSVAALTTGAYAQSSTDSAASAARTSCPPSSYDPSCAFLQPTRGGNLCSSEYGISSLSGQGFEICPGVLSYCNGNPARCLWECHTSGSLGVRSFCHNSNFTGDSRVTCGSCAPDGVHFANSIGPLGGAAPTTSTTAVSSTASATSVTSSALSLPTGCPATWTPSCAFFQSARGGGSCLTEFGFSGFDGGAATICPGGVRVCNGNAARCPWQCRSRLGNDLEPFCNPTNYTADNRVSCTQCGSGSGTGTTTNNSTGPTVLPQPTYRSEASVFASGALIVLSGVLSFMFAL
ncbi:hypothetical protein ABW21_db0206501 [Orbilia brochopaga]|nr:hypothetical protein ABW21_db0206501 [Drechslerella brochopaga]